MHYYLSSASLGIVGEPKAMMQSYNECKQQVKLSEPSTQVKFWQLTKSSFFEMLSLGGERDRQETAKHTN
jgi:hypothetical protein